MTGNAINHTERFEPNPREAADKLVANRKLALTASQHAAMSPKNNRPSRCETRLGSSCK